jgi:hypothetical protein
LPEEVGDIVRTSLKNRVFTSVFQARLMSARNAFLAIGQMDEE